MANEKPRAIVGYTARGHKLNFAGVTKLALCGAKQALRLQFVPSRGINPTLVWVRIFLYVFCNNHSKQA